MTDSHALLLEYAENGTESAFRDLVGRYISLVYSTALRQLGGDAHLAEDVAQTVFLHLARKARQIPSSVMMGGWLHLATLNVAATVRRGERRRIVRERQAVQMNVFQNDSPNTLEHVTPILDEAISKLPGEDRTAVLLRFFEKRDFRSVGEALGSSEDAARMRVNRALERLHLLLKQRGVTISAAALATGLAAEAVTAAPAGLAVSIAASALARAAGTGTALTFLKILTMTKLKLSLLATVLVAAVTTPMVIDHHAKSRLLKENQSLRQQAAQLPQLAADNERLTNELAQAKNSEVVSREQVSELLRLRGEVGSLREQKKEWERMKMAQAADHQGAASIERTETDTIPKQSWAFVGYSSPDAALQSTLWAMNKGDVKTFLASATPETQRLIQQQYAGKTDSEIGSSLADEIRGVTELPLPQRSILANGAVTFFVPVSESNDGTKRTRDEAVMRFENVGGEWKFTVSNGTSGSVGH